MEPPPRTGSLAPPVALRETPRQGPWSARRALASGALYGLVAGLLGALQIVGTALAISLNQRQILLYQDQNDAYRACLRQAAPPGACHPPTAGVLAVSGIWLLFLGSYVVAGLLALLIHGLAARAAARRTGRVGVGVVAALVAGCAGWLVYLPASVAAVLAQASPFTMGAPPPGVDTTALHVGAAIGVTIANSAALLPTVCGAALAGLIGAAGIRRERERIARPAPTPRPAGGRAASARKTAAHV